VFSDPGQDFITGRAVLEWAAEECAAQRASSRL
jgi:hypothetical protein